MSNPISWSPEQTAFFEELKEGTSSILLEARAGSGKTTTIVNGCSLLPRHLFTLFLAFNKRIDEELGKRLPIHIQHGTFHSRGAAALRRHLPKSPKIDGNKTSFFIRRLPKKQQSRYWSFITRAISIAKSAGVDIIPGETWERALARFSLLPEEGDLDEGILLAKQILEESNCDLSHIDFDDMLYQPLRLKVSFDLASYLFIDEAQDTNLVQLKLLHRMLAPAGRLIAVGDPNQSIYAFRGADSSAMDKLEAEFQMKRMPLSVSYRCSKSVIRLAQKYCK